MIVSALLIDGTRFARTGVAEAVYGPGKSAEEIAEALLRLARARREAGQETQWPVLATRVAPTVLRDVEAEIRTRDSGSGVAYDREAQLVELEPPAERRPLGRAIVVSAGTTDRGPAAEASAVLSAYGAEVDRLDDVGVAGLHRLLDPGRLEKLLAAEVVIAVAGMEGALPTVVAGLVRAPVVAVPSEVGYGVAEGGRAALHAMLASCAAGLAVVNVGNGFGAATMAVKILHGIRRGAVSKGA